MPSKSEYAIYSSLGVFLVIILGLLFLLGPLGWIAAILLVALIFPLVKWSDLLVNRQKSQPEKTNCPACGARNLTSNVTCSYCDESLAR